MEQFRRLCSAGAVALGLAVAAPVQALSVSPTIIEIDGVQKTRASVRVTAPGNAALILDLAMLERSAEGTSAPATGPAFELQPPQLFVPAGRSAEISLQWVGGAPADGSRSFYLVAEQLPVAMEPGSGENHLHVLARVHLPVHVGAAGAADLHVRHGEGGRIELLNTGTRYARFAGLALQLEVSGGTTRTIDGMDVARLVESDALLPGARIELDATTLGLAEGERALALVGRP